MKVLTIEVKKKRCSCNNEGNEHENERENNDNNNEETEFKFPITDDQIFIKFNEKLGTSSNYNESLVKYHTYFYK